MLNFEQTTKNIAQYLRAAKNVVIFTGAEVSTGIPKLQDPWSKLWLDDEPDNVASVIGLERNPSRVWNWHEQLRTQLDVVSPTALHESIARLEVLLQPARLTVITETTDGLHQAAGNSNVIELCGSLSTIRCRNRCGFVAEWPKTSFYACPVCGKPTRPNIAWIEDQQDGSLFSLAEEISSEADVFILVGDTRQARGATTLALLSKGENSLLVEVNTDLTTLSRHADFLVTNPAEEFFSEICDATAMARRGKV